MRPCQSYHPEPVTAGCRLCNLYLTDPAYRALWDSSPVVRSAARSLPCVHEENILSFCPRGDDLLHVRGCAKDHENVTRGGKCFNGCGDYSPGTHDFFDRVVVINLKRRPDRLAQFHKNLEGIQSSFKSPERFEAVDGSRFTPPPEFESGQGAFGCRQSHIRVLEQAIQDDVQSLLVLEDDAVPLSGAVGSLPEFLRNVPDDWDQLMLGGQHFKPTIPVSPGIVRAVDCQRTHAYAIRGPWMRDLYAAWVNARFHIDWVMGSMQATRNVYCADPFIFGQEAGTSDITVGYNPRKDWSGT